MPWIRDGRKVRCTDCDETFAVGSSCACPPESGATAPNDTQTSPGDSSSNHPLLTQQGQMRRLAELADACRDVTENLEVKAIEAELKVLRTMIEAATKRDTEKALRDAEVCDRALEERMSVAQGGAGRLETMPIPPITGAN